MASAPKIPRLKAAETKRLKNFPLKELQQKIRYCHRLQEPGDDLELTVVGVYRYLKDPSFSRDTGIEPQSVDYNDLDVYDIFLSDGVEQIKCLLSPACNAMVQTFKLHPGRIILVNPLNCEVHSTEKEADCNPFIIIKHLDVTRFCNKNLNPDKLRFCDDLSNVRTVESPLVTSRGCYMSLWNNEDPVGTCWTQLAPAADNARNLPQLMMTVASLARDWKITPLPYPTLLVTVLHRARIHCFAKHDKLQKWPFQIQVEVADDSGVLTIVGWNNLACLLYKQVQEGSVLLVSNYTVRCRYALMARSHDRDYELDCHDLEVVLNPPHAKVQLLDPNVSLIRPLPDTKYLFLTRQEMRHLSAESDNLNLDVIGVVCHVGRYVRKRTGENSTQFWLGRWVHVLDGSSVQPVRLLLFSTSQPEEHDRIVPGVVLLVTQMRFVMTNVQSTASSLDYRTEQYCTTTTFSQVSIFSEHVNEPLASHAFVKNLESWKSSREGLIVLEFSSTIGGYDFYPSLPFALEQYSKTFPDDKPLKPTMSQIIPDLAQSLSFRESSCVHFLGYVVNVAFHSITRTRHSASFPSTPASRTRTKRRRESIDSRDSSPSSNPPGITSTKLIKNAVPPVDVDPLWPRIMGRLPLVGSSIPHQSFFARKFRLGNDDDTLRRALLMPSEKSVPCCGSQDLEALSIVDGIEGVFVVTIVGVNDNVVICGFLPLRTDTVSSVSDADHVVEEPTFLHLFGSHSVSWPPSMASSTIPERARRLMEDAKRLHNQRFLFVLDFYNPDFCDSIEVLVKRGYPIS